MSAHQEKIVKAISNQDSLRQTFQATQNLPSVPKRKPHFRYVDYDSTSRAQHIRVKLWKLHSCNVSTLNLELKDNRSEMKQLPKPKEFERTFKWPTIKESLKYIKKFEFFSRLISDDQYLIQRCKSLKLETLNLSLIRQRRPERWLKAFRNSKLKECSVECSPHLHSKLIYSFRRVRKCNLFIKADRNDKSKTKMLLLNTGKLLPWSQLTQIDQALIIPSKSISKISYKWKPTRPQLPASPNLQQLSLYLKPSDINQSVVDLSFVKQYSKLKVLSIQLPSTQAPDFGFLVGLPCLQDLYLSFLQFGRLLKPLKLSFPSLKKLKKFGLCLDESKLLIIDNVKNFVSHNKSLQSLKLSLSSQHIADILEEVTMIESLQLDFIQSEQFDSSSARKIVGSLKRLDSIKKLSLKYNGNFVELNQVLLKEALTSMRSLEDFTLKYNRFDTTERNNFRYFPDVFESLVCLKALDLDLGENYLYSEDRKSILDALCMLKCLQKFRFTGNFSFHLSNATFTQFETFLTSIRHIKNLHASLKGIPQNTETELWQNLLPRFPLSSNPF